MAGNARFKSLAQQITASRASARLSATLRGNLLDESSEVSDFILTAGHAGDLY
jgi:hypothetical protein